MAEGFKIDWYVKGKAKILSGLKSVDRSNPAA
jgi:hypothetical protein